MIDRRHLGALGRHRGLLLDDRGQHQRLAAVGERQAGGALAPRLVQRLVHRLLHARQQAVARVVARVEIRLGQEVALLEVERDLAGQRLGLAHQLDDLGRRHAFDHGEAALHDLARLQKLDQGLHRDMRRDLVFARLDRLGRGIDHQGEAEQAIMLDDALVPQHLGHGGGSRAARDHDVLGLVERPRRGEQRVAQEQRAAHQGHEQGDEEQDPTEVAEHDSASGDQTGPKINDALVPPKPNELLRA